MKLLILGDARHGKDTVCEYLRDDFGLKFISSSLFVARKAVEPALRARGLVWESFEDMYNARVDYRSAWHDAIAEYNAADPARLGRELFAEYDIYAGLRSIREFVALHAEGAFDAVFWVARQDSHGCPYPREPRSSQKLSSEFADLVIPNHGTLEELRLAVGWAMTKTLGPARAENMRTGHAAYKRSRV